MGATVVPGGLDPAAEALAEMGIDLERVPDDLPCPMPVEYDTPDTLGVDRLLGAFAAWSELRSPLVVVDCGSATTVDAVRDGAFLGGFIAPGPAALAQALQAVPAGYGKCVS